MPKTRSRPKTEEKFQNAVLQLVVQGGCGALGINAVAQLAGADKVLIYRYFGDFNGLLLRVAESRKWLPSSRELLDALPANKDRINPLAVLRSIHQQVLDHIRTDACTHQLVRWRRTRVCPICRQFTQEWRHLWQELPTILSKQLGSEQQRLWIQACKLLALTIESDLCDEPVKRSYLEVITTGLDDITLESYSEVSNEYLFDDQLPTNLL